MEDGRVASLTEVSHVINHVVRQNQSVHHFLRPARNVFSPFVDVFGVRQGHVESADQDLGELPRLPHPQVLVVLDVVVELQTILQRPQGDQGLPHLSRGHEVFVRNQGLQQLVTLFVRQSGDIVFSES